VTYHPSYVRTFNSIEWIRIGSPAKQAEVHSLSIPLSGFERADPAPIFAPWLSIPLSGFGGGAWRVVVRDGSFNSIEWIHEPRGFHEATGHADFQFH
jgi:hypothetical protein